MRRCFFFVDYWCIKELQLSNCDIRYAKYPLISWVYWHEPKLTQCRLCLIIRTHILKRVTSIWALKWPITHVHPLVPKSGSSFFVFQSTRWNNEEENLLLVSPSNWRIEISLKQRERPPWRLGLQFLSHVFLWGFMWQNTESCFVPPLITLHPLPIVFFPPSCCLAVCAVSP